MVLAPVVIENADEPRSHRARAALDHDFWTTTASAMAYQPSGAGGKCPDRAMAKILGERAHDKRHAREMLIREAGLPKLERADVSDGGPIDPSPTVDLPGWRSNAPAAGRRAVSTSRR